MDDLSAVIAPVRTMLPILDVQNVTKRFAFGAEPITALADASLRIEKGEFVCLIGPSGCGKSTLLRMVGGFETATEGALLMWGKPVAGPGPDRGMVFQDYGLFPWLTVTQNVVFGRPRAAGPKPTFCVTVSQGNRP